jgi:type IV pilus assembly protein PilM
MPGAVWGLDIGHSSIKAVRLERAGSVAELTNFDVIEIQPGEDDNTRPERVQAALEELVRRRRFGPEPVLVAVSGNQTFFRPFVLPSVASSKLPELVRFEARQQIPFPINEVIWDFKTIAPGEGGAMRVGLVAIRRELVDQVLAQVKTFGMRLEAIQVAPVALYNFVHYEFGGKEPFLVLDAGARVTDFVIVDGEEFWFRPLPQSGNDFTRSLEQKFRMTFEEAEELKLKMGESKQAQKIFQVIEPMLRNLAGDIQRTIGYYKSIRKGAEIQRVLALGGTFRLPGLVEFLEQALDLKIELVAESRKIRLGGGVDDAWWREESASMGVALGLGLQGLGLSHVRMEFLPETMIHERLLRKKRPVVAAGVGLALLAGAGSFVGAQRDRDVAKRDSDRIKAELKDVDKFQKEFDKRMAPVVELDGKIKRWAYDSARERGWVFDALKDVSRLKGARGELVIGPDAAGGNGIHVKALYVSREAPPRALGFGPLDRSIYDWYSRATETLSGKANSQPMIAILQGEIAGEAYEEGRGQPKEADFAHAEALRTALQFSSTVYVKGSAEPRIGRLEEPTPNTGKKDVLLFTAPGGTSQEEIKRSDIVRMKWYRAVFIGINFFHEQRMPVPSYHRENLVRDAAEKGGQVPSRMRDYLQFSMAWVVDDGSTAVNDGAR